MREIIENNIRTLKEYSGLTDKDFAKQIGLQPRFFTDLKDGKTSTTIEALIKCCEMYSLSISDFVSKKLIIKLDFESMEYKIGE